MKLKGNITSAEIDETRASLLAHIEQLAKYKAIGYGKHLQGVEELCAQERQLIALTIQILESQTSRRTTEEVNRRLKDAVRGASSKLRLVPKD